jgi:hypothetical protein
MDFFIIPLIILALFVVPAVIRSKIRPPEYSKFADHEIINYKRRKIVKCTRCGKKFEWKRGSWRPLNP